MYMLHLRLSEEDGAGPLLSNHYISIAIAGDRAQLGGLMLLARCACRVGSAAFDKDTEREIAHFMMQQTLAKLAQVCLKMHDEETLDRCGCHSVLAA